MAKRKPDTPPAAPQGPIRRNDDEPTLPFLRQLLAPLPAGQRLDDLPFDADDWIMRLRDSGGSAFFLAEVAGGGFVCKIDPTDERQFAIAQEIRGRPLAKTEIRAALNARLAQDEIDCRLRMIRDTMAGARKEPENEMMQIMARGVAKAFLPVLRQRGVGEGIIQAALAGEAA